MKKTIFILTTTVLFFNGAKAQINMTSSGNVGIGSGSTSSSSTLSVNSSGSSSFATYVAPATGNIGGICYTNSGTNGNWVGIESYD